MATPTVTDQKRSDLEKAIAAALLLLLMGSHRQAANVLGIEPSPEPSTDSQDAILAKATETALLVQAGINYQMDPPPTSEYAGQPAERLLGGIRQYNTDTLIPYLDSWAQHQGRIETYLNTPAGDGSDRSARDVKPDGSQRLWTWARRSGSNEPDPCGDAEGMSPAPYDDLVAAGDGVPPTHRYCACDLYPEDWPE